MGRLTGDDVLVRMGRSEPRPTPGNLGPFPEHPWGRAFLLASCCRFLGGLCRIGLSAASRTVARKHRQLLQSRRVRSACCER